jgi:Helix-turn-helix domain
VKTSALQRQQTQSEQESLGPRLNLGNPTEPLPPGRIESPILFVSQTGGEHMRMYTEEEVAPMLRVSLSQLRKWRIKRNKGRVDGPPFRKVGRLVRYPERALQAYIDGE